ncbi:unnamed protein product [Amoebophrya sp. A25]|nr:unnamed protein product [Amoebophrya sp. A25]|eukprot:GSA25T00002072001.1
MADVFEVQWKMRDLFQQLDVQSGKGKDKTVNQMRLCYQMSQLQDHLVRASKKKMRKSCGSRSSLEFEKGQSHKQHQGTRSGSSGGVKKKAQRRLFKRFEALIEGRIHATAEESKLHKLRKSLEEEIHSCARKKKSLLQNHHQQQEVRQMIKGRRPVSASSIGSRSRPLSAGPCLQGGSSQELMGVEGQLTSVAEAKVQKLLNENLMGTPFRGDSANVGRTSAAESSNHALVKHWQQIQKMRNQVHKQFEKELKKRPMSAGAMCQHSTDSQRTPPGDGRKLFAEDMGEHQHIGSRDPCHISSSGSQHDDSSSTMRSRESTMRSSTIGSIGYGGGRNFRGETDEKGRYGGAGGSEYNYHSAAGGGNKARTRPQSGHAQGHLPADEDPDALMKPRPLSAHPTKPNNYKSTWPNTHAGHTQPRGSKRPWTSAGCFINFEKRILDRVPRESSATVKRRNKIQNRRPRPNRHRSSSFEGVMSDTGGGLNSATMVRKNKRASADELRQRYGPNCPIGLEPDEGYASDEAFIMDDADDGYASDTSEKIREAESVHHHRRIFSAAKSRENRQTLSAKIAAANEKIREAGANSSTTCLSGGSSSSVSCSTSGHVTSCGEGAAKTMREENGAPKGMSEKLQVEHLSDEVSVDAGGEHSLQIAQHLVSLEGASGVDQTAGQTAISEGANAGSLAQEGTGKQDGAMAVRAPGMKGYSAEQNKEVAADIESILAHLPSPSRRRRINPLQNRLVPTLDLSRTKGFKEDVTYPVLSTAYTSSNAADTDRQMPMDDYVHGQSSSADGLQTAVVQQHPLTINKLANASTRNREGGATTKSGSKKSRGKSRSRASSGGAKKQETSGSGAAMSNKATTPLSASAASSAASSSNKMQAVSDSNSSNGALRRKKLPSRSFTTGIDIAPQEPALQQGVVASDLTLKTDSANGVARPPIFAKEVLQSLNNFEFNTRARFAEAGIEGLEREHRQGPLGNLEVGSVARTEYAGRGNTFELNRASAHQSSNSSLHQSLSGKDLNARNLAERVDAQVRAANMRLASGSAVLLSRSSTEGEQIQRHTRNRCGNTSHSGHLHSQQTIPGSSHYTGGSSNDTPASPIGDRGAEHNHAAASEQTSNGRVGMKNPFFGTAPSVSRAAPQSAEHSQVHDDVEQARRRIYNYNDNGQRPKYATVANATDDPGLMTLDEPADDRVMLPQEESFDLRAYNDFEQSTARQHSCELLPPRYSSRAEPNFLLFKSSNAKGGNHSGKGAGRGANTNNNNYTNQSGISASSTAGPSEHDPNTGFASSSSSATQQIQHAVSMATTSLSFHGGSASTHASLDATRSSSSASAPASSLRPPPLEQPMREQSLESRAPILPPSLWEDDGLDDIEDNFLRNRSGSNASEGGSQQGTTTANKYIPSESLLPSSQSNGATPSAGAAVRSSVESLRGSSLFLLPRGQNYASGSAASMGSATPSQHLAGVGIYPIQQQQQHSSTPSNVSANRYSGSAGSALAAPSAAAPSRSLLGSRTALQTKVSVSERYPRPGSDVSIREQQPSSSSTTTAPFSGSTGATFSTGCTIEQVSLGAQPQLSSAASSSSALSSTSSLSGGHQRLPIPRQRSENRGTGFMRDSLNSEIEDAFLSSLGGSSASSGQNSGIASQSMLVHFHQ